MGSNQSNVLVSDFQKDYVLKENYHHVFFGLHSLLLHSSRQSSLIKKKVIFENASQSQLFLKEYEKIDRKPFSILYPTHMIRKSWFENCNTADELNIYFQLSKNNRALNEIVMKEGPLKAQKAWFLLNQISKALQILEQNNRSHWGISPHAIFENQNNNFLIYDTFFVFGRNPENFLLSKRERNEPLSQKAQQFLNRYTCLTKNEGHEEDIYALGITLICALTGVSYHKFPMYPEREKMIREVLHYNKNNIQDAQLIDIILRMTVRESINRITNYQLRKILKEKQSIIIHYNKPTNGSFLTYRTKNSFNSPRVHKDNSINYNEGSSLTKNNSIKSLQGLMSEKTLPKQTSFTPTKQVNRQQLFIKYSPDRIYNINYPSSQNRESPYSQNNTRNQYNESHRISPGVKLNFHYSGQK